MARDLLLELNAMKTEMGNVSTKHEKQVEAIHLSYKKVNGVRLTEDKSKAEAMRVAMDGKACCKHNWDKRGADPTNLKQNIHFAPKSVVKVPELTPSSPADNTARCLLDFERFSPS